jgi:hypothetical protein
MSPYTAQRDQFLKYLVIVEEMWVNHTPETRRASITIPDIPLPDKFKAMYSVTKIMATVF